MDRFEELLKAYIKDDETEISHEAAVHGSENTFIAQARKMRMEHTKKILKKYREIRDER